MSIQAWSERQADGERHFCSPSQSFPRRRVVTAPGLRVREGEFARKLKQI